jgi:hypothetical protein
MATATQEIQREIWGPYFAELTSVLGTVEATVEVVGRDIGDQIEAERHVLATMTYDDAADAIAVGLDAPGRQPERRELRIEHPQRVLVATGEPPPLEVTYDIEDGAQHQWLIRLERPRALPGN